MKDVTIALDEEIAARARACAARKGVSQSRFVSELLRDHMRESGPYDGAMQGFLTEFR